jgi:uncharacterized protein YidB (DUF937 family)
MTAPLGLLAIAGYQNRDKIADMLSGRGSGKLGEAGAGGVGGLLGASRLSALSPLSPPSLSGRTGMWPGRDTRPNSGSWSP